MSCCSCYAVIKRGRGGYQDWPISAQDQVPIFGCCVVQYVYRYKDFMQKAIFSEQLKVEGMNGAETVLMSLWGRDSIYVSTPYHT